MNFEPTATKTGGNDPSDVDSDKDIISLDASTQEELQYIVNISRYRNIPSDILSPFVDEMSEAGSVLSAAPLSPTINLRRVQAQLCINWLTHRDELTPPLPNLK